MGSWSSFLVLESTTYWAFSVTYRCLEPSGVGIGCGGVLDVGRACGG